MSEQQMSTDAIDRLGSLLKSELQITTAGIGGLDPLLRQIRGEIVALNNLLFVLVCTTGVTAGATILLLLRHW